MSSRRAFVLASLSGSVALLAGCLESSEDDAGDAEGMSDNDLEAVLDQYESAAATHSDAVDALGQGFTSYHDSQYEDAREQFAAAEESFAAADFRDISESITDEQEATQTVRDARETNSDAEIAASNCKTSSENLSMDPNQTSEKQTIEGVKQRYQDGEFEIPTRQDLEDAFNLE